MCTITHCAKERMKNIFLCLHIIIPYEKNGIVMGNKSSRIACGYDDGT